MYFLIVLLLYQIHFSLVLLFGFFFLAVIDDFIEESKLHSRDHQKPVLSLCLSADIAA